MTGAGDLRKRCEEAVAATAPVFLRGWIGGREHDGLKQHLLVFDRQEQTKREPESTYIGVRTGIFELGIRITSSSVGQGSSKVCSFIRKELGVPMHGGLADVPAVGGHG